MSGRHLLGDSSPSAFVSECTVRDRERLGRRSQSSVIRQESQVSPKEGRILRQAQDRPWGTRHGQRGVVMAIHKMIAVDGLPPNKWPVEHVADVDYDEPFVKDIMEISPVVDATSLSSEEREAVKHAI